MKESEPAESADKEQEEEVEDELANPNLYEDSMAEITFNETRDGGHDEDPFDRTGEYDEDVNLDAPPPITPDIPDVPPKVPIRTTSSGETSEEPEKEEEAEKK